MNANGWGSLTFMPYARIGENMLYSAGGTGGELEMICRAVYLGILWKIGQEAMR